MASIVTGTRKQITRPYLVAAGGTVVALVLATGVGLWQGARHDHATTPSTSAPAQVTTIAPISRPMSRWTEHVYLVNSYEEAARFTNYLDSLAAVGGVSVESGARVILVPNTEEEVAQALQLPAEVRRWVDPNAQVKVIDLRAQ